MITQDWSLIPLITVCVAILINLVYPVICVHDLTLRDKSIIKSSDGDMKLIDDFDGQLDADLIPPNFQPDPLLPLSAESDDNFEDIGQLNKERMGEDADDPFNRYIGNVFDSLPEAKNIFDALRIDGQLSPEGSDDDLSPIPPELLIPFLIDHRLGSEDDDDQKSQNDEKHETIKMPKLIEDSKHSNNKSNKLITKDQRKLVGKLLPIKSSSTLTAEKTTIKSTTSKPNESKDGITIDEKGDEVYGDNDDEDEIKSKKTTKSSKFRSFDNPLFKWWSKSKANHKAHGKFTTDSTATTMEVRKSSDEDDDSTSSSNSTTSTVLPSSTSKSQKSHSSTTLSPSVASPTSHGKEKSSTTSTTTSTTIKGSKASKSTTTSSITSQSSKSDSESQKSTTSSSVDKSSSNTTVTTKIKRPRVTNASTSTTKSTKVSEKNEDEDDHEDSDNHEETEDPIGAFLSALNTEQPKDDKRTTSPISTTISSSTTMTEGKHSHKHDKTTGTTSKPAIDSISTHPNLTSTTASTTPNDKDKSTTIKSDSKSNKKSTMNPETKSTIKSTTFSSNDDVFPTISENQTTTKSPDSTTRTATTTPRPSLTIQGRKTTRHPSTTTKIRPLNPYVEDSEDELYFPNWNPDIFP